MVIHIGEKKITSHHLQKINSRCVKDPNVTNKTIKKFRRNLSPLKIYKFLQNKDTYKTSKISFHLGEEDL